MFLKAKPFFIEVKTPLHSGSGSELGVIDLPIQRERTTGYPKIEGSSLKGALRERFEQSVKKELPKEVSKCKNIAEVLFGPEDNTEDNNYKSALSFTDAKILLFPVRSAKGIFVWATSKSVLKDFVENIELTGLKAPFKEIEIPKSGVSDKEVLFNDSKLLLEDYAIDLSRNDNGNKVSEIAKALSKYLSFPEESFKKKFVILEEEDFKYFVTHATEVVARTRINSDTGTVDEGALWYEEFVPEKAVFYSLALATKIFTEKCKNVFGEDDESKQAENAIKIFTQWADGRILQIGGDETIGKGICKIVIKNQAHNGGGEQNE